MFAELVCGPPGSGKTTYCEGKRQFLSVYDPTRPVTMVNLDPANDGVFPYPCDVDVRELVSLDAVMSAESLGPNGSYLFCAEVMQRHMGDWILKNIEEAVERRVDEVTQENTQGKRRNSGDALRASDPVDALSVRAPYLIIDCPGQVEFYINSTLMHELFRALQKRLQCSLCTVHLTDATVATRDVPTYVSACLLALTTMVDHELPHVNVLSKWDAVSHAGSITEDDEAESVLLPSDFVTENFDRLWRRQERRRAAEHTQAQRYATTAAAVSPSDVVGGREREEAEEGAIGGATRGIRTGGRVYKFSKALMQVVEDYGLVGYVALDVQSQDMMLQLTQEIDGAMGNFV